MMWCAKTRICGGQVIEQAKPLVDFYFTAVVSQIDLSSAREKGAAVAELAPLIAELNDES